MYILIITLSVLVEIIASRLYLSHYILLKSNISNINIRSLLTNVWILQ